MTEDDRLSAAPVLVVHVHSVFRGNRAHFCISFGLESHKTAVQVLMDFRRVQTVGQFG